MSEYKKVVISVPSGGFVRVETMASLVHMLAETPIQYGMHTPMSCYIHLNREKSVEYALQVDADYILFVDGDMTFPTDAANKLLALNVDIAGASYNYREAPRRSIVKLDEMYDAEYTVPDSVTERPIPLNMIPHPFRCAHAGTGFMLIKMDVFKAIPRPWFFFEPDIDEKGPVGEDVWFCELARKNGFDIWIEPSIQMGHIGSVIF